MSMADTKIMLPATDTTFFYECDADTYTEYIRPAPASTADHYTCEDAPGDGSLGTYKVIRPFDGCVYDFLRNAQAVSSANVQAALTISAAKSACQSQITAAIAAGSGAIQAAAEAYEAALLTADRGTALNTLLGTISAPSLQATTVPLFMCLGSIPDVATEFDTVPRVQQYTKVEKDAGEVAAIVTYVDTDCDDVSSTSLWNTEECNVSAGNSFIVTCEYSIAAGAWVGEITYYSGETCSTAISGAEIVSTDGACKENPLADDNDNELWRKKLAVNCDLDSTFVPPTAEPTEDEESGASTVSVVALASAAALSVAYSMI
jgi:hypothetical protein